MTTEPQEHDQQDPTPADSGNDGTTPPAAEPNAGTTPPDAESKAGTTPDDIEKIVKKRLERAQKQWEQERQEAEKRARMDEAERLKAELADRDKAIEEAKAEAKRERTIRNLTGKVVDAEDALAIAERLDLVDDEGQVDVDALLKAKPYLAPNGGSVDLPGARTHRKPKLTMDDVKKMSTDQINERWDEVQEVFRRG